MRIVLSLILFCLLTTTNFAQNAGIRAYAGISSAANRVLAITPEGNSHRGYHFGADGRLNSGKMHFVLGLRYTTIDLIASSDAKYFSVTDKHSIFSGRFGFGWHLIEFGKDMSFRGKLLGQLDLNSSFDANLLSAPYDDLVDATAGVTVGIGVQLKFITLDVEYEYGLVNMYRQQKETKADVISLSAGFFF